MAGERQPQGLKNIDRTPLKKAAITAGLGAAVLFLGRSAYTDPTTGEFSMNMLAKSAVKVGAVGLAEGMIGVAGITKRHHRELTHGSLELSPLLQQAIDFEQKTLGVGEPYTWAAVHRIHHHMTDTTLFPFYRIYHAVKASERQGITIDKTKTFKYLDRDVAEFDLQAVMEIGEHADTMVRERMGRLYQPPQFTDSQDIEQVLNPTEPQYYYPEHIKERKYTREDFTRDEIARILLTDPHSPALVRSENGVQGVALTNVNLYQRAADMFRQYPEVKPLDLQRPEDFDPKKKEDEKRKTRLAIAAGFGLNIAGMFIMNRDYSRRGLAKAVLEGSAINGLHAAAEIFGGNVTNSAGHMGDPVQTELAQAFLNRRYDIKLKPDGTYATNTVGKGIVGRLASWATLDEVGGQQVHHEKPWKIKYTDAEGMQAVIEAPWGSLLEYLAKNEQFGLINEGKGFGVPDDKRPDVVHPTVKRIQEARAVQYQEKLARGEIIAFDASVGRSGGLTRTADRIRTIFKKK